MHSRWSQCVSSQRKRVTTLGVQHFCEILLDYFENDVQIICVEYLLAPQNQINKIHEELFNSLGELFQNPQKYQNDPQQMILMGYSSGGDLMISCYIRLKKLNLQFKGIVAVCSYYDYSRHLYGLPSHDTFKFIEDQDTQMTKDFVRYMCSLTLKTEQDIISPKISAYFHSDQDLKLLSNFHMFYAEFDGGRRNFAAFIDKLNCLNIDFKHEMLAGCNHLVSEMAVNMNKSQEKCCKYRQCKLYYLEKLTKALRNIFEI